MACDLVGWKDILVLLKYTDKFKACRRMFQAVIGTRANVDQFRDTLEEEASLMLRRLLEDPTNFVGPVRKCVLANWGGTNPQGVDCFVLIDLDDSLYSL